MPSLLLPLLLSDFFSPFSLYFTPYLIIRIQCHVVAASSYMLPSFAFLKLFALIHPCLLTYTLSSGSACIITNTFCFAILPIPLASASLLRSSYLSSKSVYACLFFFLWSEVLVSLRSHPPPLILSSALPPTFFFSNLPPPCLHYFILLTSTIPYVSLCHHHTLFPCCFSHYFPS